MIRIGLFCIFFPLCMVLLLFYGKFELMFLLSMLCGLFFQANEAAGQFLRMEKQRLEKDRDEISEKARGETEEIRVPPLKKPQKKDSPFSSEERTEPALMGSPHKFEDAKEFRENIKERKSEPNTPARPNFQGKAHEILGISEQAATRTILRAFRYWVKRFHPDNARGLSPETAANNTRKLTEAKSVLLLKRKDKAA